MDEVERELELVIRKLASRHDDLPFMSRRLAPSETSFRQLPDEMGRLLARSPNYTSPELGEGPVWLQVEGPEAAAELIVYRTMADEALYLLAPREPDRTPDALRTLQE